MDIVSSPKEQRLTALFSPIQFGQLTLANRIVIAPMCQYAAEQGCASAWHTQHIGMLSQSGAGLMILEATAVNPTGRISYADLGLYDQDCEAALAKVLTATRAWSPMPLGIQLSHAGRKASVQVPWHGGAPLASDHPQGWAVVAPSPSRADDHQPAPRELDIDEIAAIIQDFAQAGERAQRLGFDLLEIHAAHGYLLHQFLSPLSNHRQDAYGGCLENRMRLTLEVFTAVRNRVPAHIPIGLRLSATDWMPEGWDVPQSVALAQALQERGAAYIHVSSGGLDPRQQIPVGPGYQVPLASALRAHLHIPVIAVGLITDPMQAQAIITQGHADAVALARGMLYNPRWPWHAAAALHATVPAAPQYLRCEPRHARGLFQSTPVPTQPLR